MSEIKRYESSFGSGGQDCWGEMAEAADGEYIRFSDYEKLLKQISLLKRDYEVMYKLQQGGEKQIAHQQAKIDSLMLEYCPNEMTQDQIDNWGKHQVKSSTQEIGEKDE